MSIHFKSTLSGAALLSALALQAPAQEVTLKLASTTLENQPAYAYLEEMIAEIESADVGISIDFFPAGQLGSGEELLEDAKFGNVDIVHAAIYAQADQRLEFLNLPFMITTLDDLQSKVSDPDSEYNAVLGEVLSDHGLKLLSSIGEGLIGAVAAKTPNDPTGTEGKDVNLRVWSSQLVKDTMDLLGYQTTTMSWAEVFPAVQAGTIDGAICCTSELAYTLFAQSDVGNTFIPYNAFIEQNFIYINGGRWGRLSDEQKEVLQAAAVKAAQGINDSSWKRNEEFLAKLREEGWNVVEFTDDQRADLKALIEAEVWPSVGALIGEDLLARVSQ
jgi:TRAP-type C4-dicarboxylate transport system substrate-binding protein